MALLTLPPSSDPLPGQLRMDPWTMAQPQGAEDKQLRDNARAVLLHWEERSANLLAGLPADFDYHSVPFEPAFKVRVSYKHVGELKALPYPLDD